MELTSRGFQAPIQRVRKKVTRLPSATMRMTSAVQYWSRT